MSKLRSPRSPKTKSDRKNSPRNLTIIVQSRHWISNSNTIFTESNDKWYNLLTNRLVKRKPVKCDFSIRGVMVIGTEDCIKKFWKNNIIQFEGIHGSNCSMHRYIYTPFDDIPFLVFNGTRLSKSCQTTDLCKINKKFDVDDLTKEELDTICMFGFEGICTKARVVHVVDGDTLDVVMFITLAQLCRSRKIGPKQESRTSALIQSGCEKAGFFMKIRLRLYGYDCIEKNTDNGKLATKILQEKLESINNIVWCQCIELNVSSPKYNRTIAVIYEDPECTKCLNEYLYQMEKKLQIKMVHPYTGGTKKEF